MKSGRELTKRCKGHIKNCKRRGEWSELQFMARAAKKGLRLAKPWGDSSRYDVVVETGVHFVRVQVKSTATARPMADTFPSFAIFGPSSFSSATCRKRQFLRHLQSW
jgi:PD-(D/E)XK endonuclease